ncbi:MAG: cytochrome c [Luteolibacter sp.]|jgi:mono/diheme cytochrome c family protein|nr:cytochrome c [Luteolibacter sp.]
MKCPSSTTFLALLALSPLAFGDAEAIYNKSCASCHGKDGRGQTAMGKKSKVIDYTTEEGQKWSDAEGVKAILEGMGKMKTYKDKVTEAEAKELVAYIRKFKK